MMKAFKSAVVQQNRKKKAGRRKQKNVFIRTCER